MKLTFILPVCLLVLFAGCDKFLDIKPRNKIIPQTVEEFENMLNNAVIVNSGDYFQDLITDDVFFPEAMPGNLYQNQQVHARRIFTFNNQPYDEGTNDYLWSEGYKRIFYFNTVANNIMSATGSQSEQYKKAVRAEALLGRAYEHLVMVNVYAKHYDPATAATDPGIPLALVGDIGAKYSRNTVAEVYEQIIDDLTTAIPDLPASPKKTSFRASKPAGLALLSRVYLYMGNWELAKKNAEDALALKGELFDMNNYSVVVPGPFPYVPGAPVGWTNIPPTQQHPETLYARHFLRPFGLAQLVCASSDLSALFTNEDQRWVLYYANGWPPAPPFNYWNMYQVKIFLRGEFYNNAIGIGEVYLNAAEAKARLNDMDGALDLINELRKHRLTPAAYVEKTAADFDNDPEKVLRFVLEERRRELAFMNMRHIDLKRLNKEARFQKTVVHNAEGIEYRLEPNSDKYQRQIWPAASAFNPEWELNP
ncbi:RagB/SusD family nutrient uptake outer membrane protein [Pseudoflavitalea rhizosphaerae]|uniref:RagB/SusD family nutrient uptake outer membrane protein n=1 Tax=Pseudoflavitalea rhizosphaerae TaxID=1884793 RepID=UPI000F8D7091|nr:RagB/SusD family nutrient uptake outer membrane protein [Pseudoflavitalea rhizosphaerae]